MLIPLGFLAASGAESATFQLLETTVLTGSQASVEFTNLTTKYASTYQHLQIRMTARMTGSNNFENLLVRLNSDTGSNYARHALLGNGSGVSSSASTSQTTMNLGPVPAGGNQGSGQFGAAVIDILDPYESKNKTIRNLFGKHTPTGGETWVGLTSGVWLNTASLTTILLYPETASQFATGSCFSLYGLKAA
jgi:hypothetical protein